MKATIESQPAVVVLDANNLLHRYFHAVPTQIGGEGKNVNAVRGLSALVGRLWREFHPQSIVAAFDAGDSGRTELFPAYKANRDGAPPELAYQMDLARRYFPTHYHVDVVEVEGFEADDVIVTVVGRLRTRGVPAIVVSNDKDLTCIVTDAAPTVRLYTSGGEGWRLIDAAAVKERLGVPPEAVIDYLALCGDAADGVPGVPGIGPKTAASLLERFGSLGSLLANLGAVERPRVRDLLTQHADQALLARRVLQPVEVPPEAILAGTRRARAWEPELKRPATTISNS